MNIREEVSAALLDETVENVGSRLGVAYEVEDFRARLVHILTRFETGRAGAPDTAKKMRRAQFSRLEKRATELLRLLHELPPSLSCDLAATLEDQAIERIIDSGTFNLEAKLPDGNYELAQAVSALSEIADACSSRVSELEPTNRKTKARANTALEQLIVDLEGLYESHTEHVARSHCYRNDGAPGGYDGAFFYMVKALLDGYAPGSYHSDAALGMRILRVLEMELPNT